jgi:hypothetical protein
MQKTVVAAAILLMAGTSAAAARASGAQASPSTKTSATAFDPCALLTKQEAATAVGEAVGEPKPIGPGRSAMPGMSVVACEYESATSHSGHSVQVTVWRFSGDSAGMSLQIYRAECMKKERLPGLGDLACWYNAEHRELQVLKGATILTVEIKRNGDATEALTTVAKKAVGRLP